MPPEKINMFRIIVIFLYLTGFSHSIAAENSSVTINGEKFSKTFVGNSPNGDKLIEFVKENESFKNWTKLIAFRYQQLPKIKNEPKQAGIAMYKISQASYPGTKLGMMLNKTETDAIVHFLAWPKNGEKYIEFNIFRYVKSRDNNAVVSLQVAFRMPLTKEASKVKELKATQMSLLSDASKYDMNTVQNTIDKLLHNKTIKNVRNLTQ